MSRQPTRSKLRNESFCTAGTAISLEGFQSIRNTGAAPSRATLEPSSADNPDGEDDFPDKLTSTLAWSLKNWSATLEVDRYGSIVNSGETGYLTPTALANASVQYKLGRATFGVIVNNLLDTIKRDNSYGWPFYAVGYYLPYGRQGWVEFSYHFGDT